MEGVNNFGFRAMGCDVVGACSVDEDPATVDREARRVQAVIARLESKFSRFLTDSELSHVNGRRGKPVRVSEEFRAVLDLALSASELTGGLFDPTLLEALENAGYDRDFDSLRDRTPGSTEPGPAGRWSDVVLDGDVVTLPADVRLDFGGLAKGWAVDRAAEAITDLDWVLVNAGGDLRVCGDAEAVSVGVADPFSGEELTRLGLRGGALATSSVTRRTWGVGLHHIIDPRSGRPAIVDVVQATAWSETCAGAEIAAKWLVLGGPEVLSNVVGLVVRQTGEVETNIEGLELRGAA
jgi:thiamine biosynthesis lipoprotein